MSRLPSIGLRGRLAIAIAFILLGALTVTYFAVYRGTGTELRQRTEADLEREVETLSRKMVSDPVLTPEGYSQRASQLAMAENFGTSSRVVSITVGGGIPQTNQPDLLGLGAGDEEGPDHSEEESDEHGPGGDDEHHGPGDALELLEADSGFTSVEVDDVGEVRLLTRTVPLPGGNAARISVGEPLAPVDRALEGFSDTFLIVGLVTLLLAAAAGWLLASFTTKPMRRMTEVAEGVDGGDLSSRMPISETRNDEVRRLAESFNGMLDRLEGAFTRQRAFVADASHDLRTPLTIVKGQLEVLSRQSEPTAEDVSRVSSIVAAATARMERLVDDMLLLAQAESDEGLTFEKCDLQPLFEAEIEGFTETSDRHFVVGEVTADEVLVDRERLARVMSNLIANAVAHTGSGGTIEVSAVKAGTRVEIAVDDDGPGVPEAMRARVFDRFTRLDESRSSSQGGSGLGLAIVKAIAEAHGGSVACLSSPLGGARFVVSLPAGG